MSGIHFSVSNTDQPVKTGKVSQETAVSWADDGRKALFEQWMDALAIAHGIVPQSLRPASADASFRRYLRVDTIAGQSCVIMDAPPGCEDTRSFVKVAGLMANAGVRVPEILAADEANGFLLLSDLGTTTMLQAIQKEAMDARAASPLYRQACEILVRWQCASRPGVLPVYDEALLRREMALFSDWYIARYRGKVLDDTQKNALEAVFATIVRQNLSEAQVYVHRDFMPRNLMVPQNAAGELGVLDFQDAVYGSISYDIASLMRDAFVSWEEDVVLDITIRYWQAARKANLPVPADFADFYCNVEWMGLQRHLKVAGIFARLTLRDGKPQYLRDAPRFIAYIRATATRYRTLKPLLLLLDEIEGCEPVEAFSFGRP